MMSSFAGLHGPAGLVLLCFLLFAEEAGLPLPIAPGEAMLIAAGLLIASGGAPAWVVIGACYIAVTAGALTGFGWATAVGRTRIRRVVGWFHASAAFDRAAQRLATADPRTIGVSRLIPGLRIYTTLVAGAVGIPLRTFLLGALPAMAGWVLAFVLLGIFVGAPAARLLGRFESWTLRGAELGGLLVVFYLAMRYLPGVARVRQGRMAPTLRREALALVVDIGTVALVVASLSLLTGLVGQDFDSVLSGLAIYGVLGTGYVVVARRSVGVTLGEALLDIRYQRPQRIAI